MTLKIQRRFKRCRRLHTDRQPPLIGRSGHIWASLQPRKLCPVVVSVSPVTALLVPTMRGSARAVLITD
jgi:hypothetical protein